MCNTFHATKAQAKHWLKQILKFNYPTGQSITIIWMHTQVYDKPHEKKGIEFLYIYIYMFEIAGDAFFLGLLFNFFSGEHNHPP